MVRETTHSHQGNHDGGTRWRWEEEEALINAVAKHGRRFKFLKSDPDFADALKNRTSNQLKMKWWIMGRDYSQGPKGLNQSPNCGFRTSIPPPTPKRRLLSPTVQTDSDHAPSPSLSVSSPLGEGKSSHFPELDEDFQMSVQDFESALREDSVALPERESQLDPELVDMTEEEMEDALEDLDKNFALLNKKKLVLEKVVKRKGADFEMSERYEKAVADLQKTEEVLNHAKEQLLLKKELLSKSLASPTLKSSSFLVNTPKETISKNKRYQKSRSTRKKIRRRL